MVMDVGFLFKKVSVPWPLSPLYELPKESIAVYTTYLPSLVFLLMIAWVIIRFRANQWVWFSFAYYFASIFFLLRFDEHDINFVADRFMYLPSLGFCFLFGVSLNLFLDHIRLNQKKLIAAQITILVLFLSLGFTTYTYSNIWQKDTTLWIHALKFYPRNVQALVYRANAYNIQGNFSAAISDANKALNIDPDSFLAYYYRANSYASSSQHEQALNDYQKAILINPIFSDVYLNRGFLFQKIGERKHALEDYNTVLELQPRNVTALVNRGAIYGLEGKNKLALADFNRATAINPRHINSLISRGVQYAIMGQYDKALDDLNTALSMEPNNPIALSNKTLLIRNFRGRTP